MAQRRQAVPSINPSHKYARPHDTLRSRSAALLIGGLVVGQALAGGIQTLDTVEVLDTAEDLVGVADSASQGTILKEQLAYRPLLRPGELLEIIPGLIITQHSGSGKANQYYLRGFNLDHGTDFGVYVDGMPVNMPTHAHGQGYADLNFLIPELIGNIQYKKGPYFADEGDFASAGVAHVHYADSLASGIAEAGLGQDGYQRVLVADSPQLGSGRLLYALETQRYDGPWDLPEDLKKYNGVLRYSQGDGDTGWDVTAMAYNNDWNSTDQIPQRAIDSGLIGRFGNLDPTDGGNSDRYSLSASWRNLNAAGRTQANAYFIDYSLDLFSNFTFYLDDPVNGDQFEQRDDRKVYGGGLSHAWLGQLGGHDTEHTLGAQLRRDDIDSVGLYKTRARQRLSTVRQDSVQQTGLGLYYQNSTQWNGWLRTLAGLRGDLYDFDVDSDNPANSGSDRESLLSPKLSFVFGPWNRTEYYLNMGRGFHSNDARGTTITIDPSSGMPAQQVDALVPSKGYEIGLRSVPVRGLQTSLALFILDIDSELLFVGDAGSTEASRPSRRVGVEWANLWKPNAWLTLDADFAYTRAHFRDDDPAGKRIPGALEGTASIGLTAERGPWFGATRLRYFGPRPLIEDDSVRSASTTLVNLETGYRFSKRVQATLSIFNLFDREVADIDYYYSSQLAGEPAPVDDIHTHPAEPRELRLALRLNF